MLGEDDLVNPPGRGLVPPLDRIALSAMGRRSGRSGQERPARAANIAAIVEAERGNYQPLIDFARGGSPPPNSPAIP